MNNIFNQKFDLSNKNKTALGYALKLLVSFTRVLYFNIDYTHANLKRLDINSQL